MKGFLGTHQQVGLCLVHHAPTSGSVKLHSWVTVIDQQRTEPGRLGVLKLTYPYSLSRIFIRQCDILWSALRKPNAKSPNGLSSE
jgi:hypothetical protein